VIDLEGNPFEIDLMLTFLYTADYAFDTKTVQRQASKFARADVLSTYRFVAYANVVGPTNMLMLYSSLKQQTF
jgi:hypothetical protein